MVSSWRSIHRVITGESPTRQFLFYSSFAAVQFFCLSHLFANHVGTLRNTYGPSMLPTLNARGDWVFINTSYRRGKGVKVGDIVSFKHPMFPGESASKRVLGMPGDYVMRHTPGSGNGAMLQVPEGHCWVAGDNQLHSRDSRDYGPIPLALINGKVTWRVWPLSQMQKLQSTMEPIKGDRGFMRNA